MKENKELFLKPLLDNYYRYKVDKGVKELYSAEETVTQG